MHRYVLCIFLVAIGLSRVTHGFSGYLYRETNGPRGRAIDNDNNKVDNCELNVESDEKIDTDHQVFSGNGYKYGLNCRVNDIHSNHGDKYYVIDLVVYGPNKRVSKAWHEQYQASEGRHISMSKQISFYWLGYSSVICSVSKYNKATNKFTKICQANDKVFVKENPIFKSQPTTKQQTRHRKIQLSNKSQTEIFTPNSFEAEIVPNTTLDQNATHMSTDAFNLTLNVRAMQYRDLYKANSKLDSESTNNKAKRAVIQPVVLALVFFFIFCVSIGTIAYLSYNQKLTTAYETVNRKDNNNQLAVDEISLERYKKRPKSYATSESVDDSVSHDTNSNSNNAVIYKGTIEQTTRLIEQA